MRKKKGGFLSLPVLAVILMMGFVYYATVFVVLGDWLGLESSPGLVNAVIFSWFAFMCFVSFFVAAFTDPGGIPSSFAPEMEDPQREHGVNSRYCGKCRLYKPPRSHHCRVCKRCVLKMDHHCVWISNCVGYGNYKPFIIFVFHAAIASIYSMVIFTCDIFQKDHHFDGMSPKLFYISFGSIVVFLSLTLGSLLCWHLYLLAHNLTTIEYREAVRAMWLAKKTGQNYRHPFDLGVYNNLALILGPNMLKWLCPIAMSHLRDGTQFPISND
ncbi:probable protein S-acyltransferase 15 [Typha angustifolia]|uniref:probable protein S-acyltransferase 15 n=1 Tax=Typha angustifolia TaxID=59011 RepID=UPI003C2BCE76